MRTQRIVCATAFALLLWLTGCGGGGSSESGPTPSGIAPQPGGSAPNGGTITGPAGSQVVVPAGALSQNVLIEITQSSSGAPALPPGVTAVGQIFAFTPHGTTFSKPATVTVPFDPARVPAGFSATLYKTNATQSAWEAVTGATASGGMMQGQVTGFSYFVVAAPPPLELEWIRREWEFSASTHGRGFRQLGDRGHVNGGGVVDDLRMVGGLLVRPQDQPDGARLHVFSSDTGGTYWVSAQVPAGDPTDPTRIDGTQSDLHQRQYFIKNDRNATLRFTLSQSLLELIDASPDSQEPRAPICEGQLDCRTLQAVVSLVARAQNYDKGIDVADAWAVAKLDGYQQHWSTVAFGSDASDEEWAERFEFNGDVDGPPGSHARFRLKRPVTFEIPLTDVDVGEMVVLIMDATAHARDYRHSFSYAGAFMRDPISTDGVAIEYTGLTPTAAPDGPLAPRVEPTAPECAGAADPAAGTLQFQQASFVAYEDEPSAWIFVTRTDGSHGEVSALLETRDGTGIAGQHYRSVSTPVHFADGQSGRRLIEIPILADTTEEENRTIQLQLSDVRGCAAPGSPTTAVLTLVDDDEPLPTPTPTHSVGFTVVGLAGSGLVVEDAITGASVAPATDGTYKFGFEYNSGVAYDVRIQTQPQSPNQSCIVRRGSGTVADADITNIRIECTTPAAPGELDPDFGTAGKVVVNDLDVGKAVVVQSDDRIVVLTSRLGTPVLARFNTDGTADVTFGNGGRADVRFNGGIGEEAYGLSVQSDNKLIVVGRARTDTRFDMAVARFNANGTVDMGFGTQGVTTLNPLAEVNPDDIIVGNHRANRALLTADAKIYVAGSASYRDRLTGEARTLFAVARLNPDGSVDRGFGVTATSLIYGPGFTNNAVAFGLALQSDGKVVLAGSAIDSTRVGMARFKTNGGLDTDDPPVPGNYGPGGVGSLVFEPSAGGTGVASDLVMLEDNSTAVATNAAVTDPTNGGGVSRIRLYHIDSNGNDPRGDFTDTPLGPDNDVANQLVRLSNGKLVLAAQASSATTVSDFGIVRYNADLTLDASFGTNGAVRVDFFGARDGATSLAIQHDGKIVAAGSTRNGTSDVLGITRIVQ
jgi:uncharacterized delta-60 repeat protein